MALTESWRVRRPLLMHDEKCVREITQITSLKMYMVKAGPAKARLSGSCTKHTFYFISDQSLEDFQRIVTPGWGYKQYGTVNYLGI